MADPLIFTLHIDPEECIGDSLDTINQNFLNLDTGIQALSASSLGWVNSNSATITESYTWVRNNSADTESVCTWYVANSTFNFNINSWVAQNSATIGQGTTFILSNSSNTSNAYTWVRRNSSDVTQLINTRSYIKSSRESIYPSNVLTKKNNFESISNYSVLAGGSDNYLRGDYSTIAGGSTNILSANRSVIAGGFGIRLQGDLNVICGGSLHNVSGTDNFLGGGNTNSLSFKYGVIGGGLRNTVLNDYCGILGGINNKAVHSNTFVLGSNITTVIPNATYVNNLVIKDIPSVDNGNSSLLLRDNNGVVRTKLIPNLANIEPLYMWVKTNSSAFVSTTMMEGISSNVTQTVINTVSTSVQTNFNILSTIQENKILALDDNVTAVIELTANWNGVYDTVQMLSSTWGYQGDDLKSLSANWENTFTTVQGNSAQWLTQNTANILTTALQDASGSSNSTAIDLTKSVNKLVPYSITGNVGRYHYTLADGMEGQILHLVPANSFDGSDTSEYTMLKISHARYIQDSNVIEGEDVPKWLPFHGQGQAQPQSALVTLIFTDGYWNLPHNMFDQ